MNGSSLIKELRRALHYYVDSHEVLAPLLQSHTPMNYCGCEGCGYERVYKAHKKLLDVAEAAEEQTAGQPRKGKP